MSTNIPAPERTIHRIPRTDDEIVIYLTQLRVDYPPPEHDVRYGTNPADLVLEQMASYSKKKLKRLCVRHSLDPTGGRRRMLKRMYLHWRASKFETGDPYIGYGPGFQFTKIPDCACGFRKRADMVKEARAKEERKEMIAKQKKKLNKLWDKAFDLREERRLHPRFPRLLFPRLRIEDVYRIRKHGYRKWKERYS